MLEVMYENIQRAQRAENDRLLNEAQKLVDQGIRLRDIVILERRGEFGGRRVVTKAAAALFEEMVEESSSGEDDLPRELWVPHCIGGA